MATFNSFQVDPGSFYRSDVTQVWGGDNTQLALNFATEPYHQEGYLMPGPESTPKYVMRAFNTGLGRHVYWEVPDPDPTGQFSGFSPSVLTDIVLFQEVCTEDTHT